MEAVIAAAQSPPGLDAVRALLSENDNSASRPCQVRANAAALTYTTMELNHSRGSAAVLKRLHYWKGKWYEYYSVATASTDWCG